MSVPLVHQSTPSLSNSMDGFRFITRTPSLSTPWVRQVSRGDEGVTGVGPRTRVVTEYPLSELQ